MTAQRRFWIRPGLGLGLSLLLSLLTACSSSTEQGSDLAGDETSGALAGNGSATNMAASPPATPSASDGDGTSARSDGADGSSDFGSADAPAGGTASAAGSGGGGMTTSGSSAAPAVSAPAPGSPAAPTDPGGVPAPAAMGPASASGEGVAADTDAASTSEPPPPDGGGSGNVQSGTLTAGAWDDNLNFQRFDDYRRGYDGLAGALHTEDEEHEAALEAFGGEREANDTVDIALVIDTTGSMGDEIWYLQAEFDALTKAIAEAHPDADQRWALIAYKDEGDVYTVRTTDFTGDMTEYAGSLNGISAAGGGDYPEAPDQALAALSELDFRTDASTARLAFWVGDAPHHNQNADNLLAAVRDAAGADVHIYPVASSGVDELTELTMRISAQLTGGRYLFLTDDSGVGGAHKEPTIPCYFVTRLDQAILRMVDIELTGTYREPEEDHIIRTGGDPEDGACTLESGEEVVVF